METRMLVILVALVAYAHLPTIQGQQCYDDYGLHLGQCIDRAITCCSTTIDNRANLCSNGLDCCRKEPDCHSLPDAVCKPVGRIHCVPKVGSCPSNKVCCEGKRNEVPSEPSIPELPQVPEVPEVPGPPEIPGLPQIPGLPGGPDIGLGGLAPPGGLQPPGLPNPPVPTSPTMPNLPPIPIPNLPNIPTIPNPDFGGLPTPVPQGPDVICSPSGQKDACSVVADPDITMIDHNFLISNGFSDLNDGSSPKDAIWNTCQGEKIQTSTRVPICNGIRVCLHEQVPRYLKCLKTLCGPYMSLNIASDSDMDGWEYHCAGDAVDVVLDENNKCDVTEAEKLCTMLEGVYKTFTYWTTHIVHCHFFR